MKTITGNMIATLVSTLGLKWDDQIIPGRGELYYDEARKEFYLQFKRPDVPGEFHVAFRIDHLKPFVPQEQRFPHLYAKPKLYHRTMERIRRFFL